MRLVPVKYLREGSCIAINVINNEGNLLLNADQKITQHGIEVLKEIGVSYVYIKDEYCYNNERPEYMIDIDKIHGSIKKLKKIAYRCIEGTADATDLQEATGVAEKIAKGILQVKDSYRIVYEPTKLVVDSMIERTIYVAIMSVALGAKMNLSEERLVKLCLAALLKDVALVSPKVNNRDDTHYKMHPKIGYEYLKKKYALDEEILEAILQHHERADGSGYPNKLKGDEIGDFAKIISIIDFFYEIKSNHDMIEGSQGVFDARLKKLLRSFDVKVLGYFLKNTELFTLDTLVRLSNDDVGVIIKNGTRDPFKPTVKIVKSNRGLEGVIVDLQRNNNKLLIKSIESYV